MASGYMLGGQEAFVVNGVALDSRQYKLENAKATTGRSRLAFESSCQRDDGRANPREDQEA